MSIRLRAALALPLVVLLLTSCSDDAGDDRSDSAGGATSSETPQSPTPTDASTPTGAASPTDATSPTQDAAPTGTASPTAPPAPRGPDAKRYVDALTRSLQGADSPLDATQARCFSERFIDVVGLDRVKRSGSAEDFGRRGMEFTALDLSRGEGDAIFDNFGACGVDIRQALLDELSAGGLEPGAERCLRQQTTDQHVRDFFVVMMVEGPEQGARSDLMGVFRVCSQDAG